MQLPTVAVMISSISPDRTCGLKARENCNGYDGAPSVANSIRLHHHLPYHFSILHDRLGSLAHCSRGVASCDRSASLSPDLRLLADDIWGGVWFGRLIRD